MVEEAVEHGGGDRAITVEDGSPLFEGFVGGKYDRTAFVARVEEAPDCGLWCYSLEACC